MKTRSTFHWIRSIASLLLLFGYFLNIVSFESFHRTIHHHGHSELHTKTSEADPCHRAIYHGETSRDCEHQTHVTKTIADCDLCKVTVSRFHFASHVTQSVLQSFEYKAYLNNRNDKFGFVRFDASSPRGPPALS